MQWKSGDKLFCAEKGDHLSLSLMMAFGTDLRCALIVRRKWVTASPPQKNNFVTLLPGRLLSEQP